VCDPAAWSVELPPTAASSAKVWDADKAGAFLDFVRDDRLYAMYLLVIMAGLRRGETIGLRWEDVHLDDGYLRIAQQIVEVGGQVYVGPPKTKAGVHPVALNAATVEALKAHRTAQRRERLAGGEAWNDTGLVFTQEDGRMLMLAYVTMRFRALAKDAGQPVIRFHDLRHTCASLALAADVPMKVVRPARALDGDDHGEPVRKGAPGRRPRRGQPHANAVPHVRVLAREEAV
jgi:integrase